MTKNKKSLALLVGAILATALPSGAFAQTAMLPAGASLSVTPSVVSNYMFRGTRLGGLSFQGAAELTAGSLATGVWWNNPIEQDVPGVSDPEFDVYASYGIPLSDSLTLTPGGTWYVYPNADKSAGSFKQTLEFSASLDYTSGGFAASPKFYWDTKLKQATLELGASYTMPIEGWDTTVTLSGLVGTYLADRAANSNVDTKAWGDYYQFGINAPYQVSEFSSIDFGVAYHAGSNSYVNAKGSGNVKNSLEDERVVFSAAYSFNF
jgi:uncharacterized protein (TIGR02001 family)